MHLKTLLNTVFKKRFAIIFLFGGSGNQIYKYVLSNYLANNNHYILMITLQTPKSDTQRQTIYKNINFRNSKIKFLEIKFISQSFVNKLIVILNFLFKPLSRYVFFMNDKVKLDLNIINIKKFKPKFIIANGYFHESNFYRKNIFLLKKILTYEKYKKKYTNPYYKDKIAIHYRIGDYATNVNAKKTHGVLSPIYFEESIKFLLKLNKNIKSIDIFSDSPKVAIKYLEKRNFNLPLRVVDTNFLNDIEKIIKISLYKNIIISNSTFSWWSVLLASESNDSLIVMPEKFYKKNPGIKYNYKIDLSNVYYQENKFLN